MKIKFLLIILLIISIISCNSDDSSKNLLDDRISLVSPNGYEIAKNMDELKLTTGINKSVGDITKIVYQEDDKYNAAFIYYIDPNGIEKNTVIAKGKFNYESQSIEYVFDGPFSNSTSKGVKLSCINCDCKVQSTTDLNTGLTTFSCSEPCCSLSVEYPPAGG